MKRKIADMLLWFLGPITNWCYNNCTWIPMEDINPNLDVRHGGWCGGWVDTDTDSTWEDS